MSIRDVLDTTKFPRCTPGPAGGIECTANQLVNPASENCIENPTVADIDTSCTRVEP